MNLDKINTLAILGDRHTAKTNLMVYFMRKYKGEKKLYLLGYPVKVKGFGQINTLSEVSALTDAIIGCDELQKVIPFYQKRANDTFLDLLSTMVHNNNTFLFTTPLSQFITKALDGFIDGFCYTRMLDLGVLKNGSKAKRRLQEFKNSKINKWGINLKVGEYFEIIDSNKIGENGLKKFPDQFIGKDWKPNAKKTLIKP